jgi:hypothetical protein
VIDNDKNIYYHLLYFNDNFKQHVCVIYYENIKYNNYNSIINNDINPVLEFSWVFNLEKLNFLEKYIRYNISGVKDLKK